MAKSHDVAARRIAKILKGRYTPGKSPDVKGKLGRAEVKSKANETPEALRQLGGGSGDAYIVLPKPEHPEALRRLKQHKTGLRNYQGKIIKPSTRK
jgi:hypothetical protein